MEWRFSTDDSFTNSSPQRDERLGEPWVGSTSTVHDRHHYRCSIRLFLKKYGTEKASINVQRNVGLRNFVRVISMSKVSKVVDGLQLLTPTLGLCWKQIHTQLVGKLVIRILIVKYSHNAAKIFAQLRNSGVCGGDRPRLYPFRSLTRSPSIWVHQINLGDG